MTNGERLLLLRRRARLTQAELAAAAGHAGQYISRLESGVNIGTLATWTSLADALGVPIGDLVGKTGPDEASAES